MLATQVRYQLIMLVRNPRAVMAGLILPGLLLALQAGKVKFANRKWRRLVDILTEA